MYTRTLPRLVLVALAGTFVGGCADDAAPTATSLTDGGMYAGLSVVGEPTRVVLPGGTEELVVSYAGASGTPVEFAVLAPEVEADRSSAEGALSVPPGASLEPANALVDGSGLALTRLTVGSTPGTFRVRARIPGVAPVFFEVEVSAAQKPSLSVFVRYEGLREVVSRSATVLAGVSCGEELPADKANVEVHTADDPKTALEFFLVPKVRYAVLAWGRDASGAAQAYGCVEHTASLTDDKASAEAVVYVDIEDRALRFAGSYSLELVLDLSNSMARLSQVAEEAARTLLGEEEHADAALYLDAVHETLVELGKTSEAALWAERRAGVVAGLSAALSQKGAGLEASATELGQGLTRIGRSLSVRAALGVGAANVPMTLAVTSLVARSMEGTVAFDLMSNFSKLAPSAQILATYDDARAQVNVQNLGIGLGLGTYGGALLDALAARVEAPSYAPALRASAGCDPASVFVVNEPALQEGEAPLCDAACAAQACDRVLTELVEEVRAAMTPLDAEHATISLTGPVSAHDREGDETIDDLGASALTGNWGKAAGASAEDGVSATLSSVPSENALTL